MKTLLLLLLSCRLFSQCDPDGTANPYFSQPSFVSLYLSGSCLDFPTSPAIIEYNQLPNSIQYPGFSFAGNGSVSLTGLTLFDSNCDTIQGNVILQGLSVVYAEFTFTGTPELWCPFSISESVLSVDFLEVKASWKAGILKAEVSTGSNQNTNKYSLEYSSDLITWLPLIDFAPYSENSSTEHAYLKYIPFDFSGQFYMRCVEESFSGEKTESMVSPFMSSKKAWNGGQFDIIGRTVSSGWVIGD